MVVHFYRRPYRAVQWFNSVEAAWWGGGGGGFVLLRIAAVTARWGCGDAQTDLVVVSPLRSPPLEDLLCRQCNRSVNRQGVGQPTPRARFRELLAKMLVDNACWTLRGGGHERLALLKGEATRDLVRDAQRGQMAREAAEPTERHGFRA